MYEILGSSIYPVSKNYERIKEKVKFPKPKKLLGGENLQKYPNRPYWFCDLGNSKFMCLYTKDLTEDDLLYDYVTEKPRRFRNMSEAIFKESVLDSLKHLPKEGYCWLPVYEPSFNRNRGLQFCPGQKPGIGLSAREWEAIFRNYSQQNGSGIANKYVIFHLYLRWLKDGFATVQQLSDDSTYIGNYRSSYRTSNYFEFGGQRECGGLFGFVGNTNKVVKDEYFKNTYYYFGGSYLREGYINPIGLCNKYDESLKCESVGIMVMKGR